MDDSGILGKTLGQLGSIAKKTGEEIIKKPEEMAGDVASEFGLKTDAAPQASKPEVSDEQATKEVVKSLYAPSEKKKDGAQSSKPDDSEFTKQIASLRRKLHQEYYEKLVNPPKQQEERPAEKVEKEKKQEMSELQQKEEKKPPALIQRARERVEKFPGASG